MAPRLKRILLSLICLLLFAGAGFSLYVSDYYRADDVAVAALSGSAIETQGSLTILRPSGSGERGLIFYPGGKVEYLAYLPLLEQLRQQGVTCVLVETPFHLAIFAPDAAEQVFNALPEVTNWFIGGHSLGGAMASDYAARHPDQVRGAGAAGGLSIRRFPCPTVADALWK